MSQIQIKSGWFLLSDKWHREGFVHFIEPNKNLTVCGSQEINEVNVDSMLHFGSIDNLPVSDICKKCLKKKL